MDPALIELFGKITGVTSMSKMAKIEPLAKEYGFDDATVSELVPALCRLVMSNMENKDNVVRFVAHVMDAATEAGPQMQEILKTNAEQIAALLEKQKGDGDGKSD